MAASIPLRNALFRHFARCLMGFTAAGTPADVLAALEALMRELPINWYTVERFSTGRVGKRVVSHRCPRGFPAFVSGLGFLRREDGTYQGTFAEATLVIVKVGAATGDRGLFAAVGLPRHSPLNDGAIAECLGALIHSVLSRALWLDDDARRRGVLDACVGANDELVALFDAAGSLLEQYPSTRPSPVAATLFPRAVHSGRHGRSMQVVLENDGLAYNVRLGRLATVRPLDGYYWLFRARPRSDVPVAVSERLEGFNLSKREFQIAERVFAGQTNQSIADALFISPDTVKTHCKRIFGKLGISRRTEFMRVLDATPPAPPRRRIASL